MRENRSISASRLLAELNVCAEDELTYVAGLPLSINAEHIHDYDLAVLYKRTQHALDDYKRMRQGLVNLAAIVSKGTDDSATDPAVGDQAAPSSD